MNIIGAIIAGLTGTIAMSIMMSIAPRMGMPVMDIVGLLSTLFNKNGNRTFGWVMHLMMGTIFALIYAGLWSVGVGTPSWLGGMVFAAGQWLVAGLVMGGVPMMHAGVKAGTVMAPGIYMMKNGGMMAFAGGLLGHLVFGLVVALVYGIFI